MSTTPLIIEVILDAPADRVWEALTDPSQMKHWYFDIPDFLPEYGAEFSFLAGPADKQYLHLCKITDIIKEDKLGYSWAFEGVPGGSHVTFELFAEGQQTKLVLAHEGLETFPADRDPNLSRNSFERGWNKILHVDLKQFLNK